MDREELAALGLTEEEINAVPVTEPPKTLCTVPGCSGNHLPCIVGHSVDPTDRNRFCVRHDLTLCGKPGGCGLTEKTVGAFPI